MRQPASLLVVDDDPMNRDLMAQQLEGLADEILTARDGVAALDRLRAGFPGIVVTDVRMPRMDGLELLRRAREIDAELPVILVTGHGDIAMAVQAMRDGAYDFIERPYVPERLRTMAGRALQARGLVLDNRALRAELRAGSGLDARLLGNSAAMEELRRVIAAVADTGANVLIVGETGTGKELVARSLHALSRRSRHRFVAVNCAALPESLFESELFGHEAGAFTGASKQRIGKIEHAKDGTLFLDEIEAMPLALQAKVLRVIQEREIERLGNNKPIQVNFRVVAATKVSLEDLAKKGEFRPDLFYRLNVASLKIPALRDRLGDILGLFQIFLQQASLRFQMPVPSLTPDQHQALLASRWPGNVRELKACAERMILGLPIFVDGEPTASAPRSFDESVAMIERSLLEEALRRHGGSVKAACAELSLTPATMYRKLKALAVDPSAYKDPAADPAG